MSMSRAKWGLCPTRTRPDYLKWGRFQLVADLDVVSDQAGQVISDFRFSDIASFGRNLAGSNEIW